MVFGLGSGMSTPSWSWLKKEKKMQLGRAARRFAQTELFIERLQSLWDVVVGDASIISLIWAEW
jgi:hypothetical protein